jgi:dTDP-4-amino-4,6-dideoxygalactose transaminase
MNVKFVDLKSQYNSIKSEIDKAISNVIDETAFIGGKYVDQFEREFEKIYDVKHCISVANGTDSLYIIMKMLGIGYGDEVITVANSWISSSETITQTGARPVFVDIDPDYYTIDESRIEEKVNKNTKALIIVHLYGQVCEMDKIIKIAEKYNLKIIEDCAQSHFSEYNGEKAGTLGIAGSFSFYPGKNLGAYGDAGCIITNNDELAMKCRMFARHGAIKKHYHQIEGINSRLDGLQAAILLAKLPHIIKWTNKRIENAKIYIDIFQNTNCPIQIPKIRKTSKHTFHLFVIRVNNREELIKFLKESGIETAIHYPKALPNLECYKYLNIDNQAYPIATDYQDKILSLPMYPELEVKQIEYVVSKIIEFYNK